jgi:hypothetical protein
MPDHSGLRPLSPFGEGYCIRCHFIIGLDADGKVEEHKRWVANSYGRPDQDGRCKGSGKKPPALTPHTSYKARFKETPERVECAVCHRSLNLHIDGVLPGHSMSQYTGAPCPGAWHRPGWTNEQ